MTENRIFQILLKNTNFTGDYPKLQKEATDIIAEKFADILYETNQKSTSSQLLRGKVLKYLHTTCGVRQCHIEEDSYESFLRILRKSLEPILPEDVLKLTSQIDSELEDDVPITLSDKMVDFYKRKNSKRKEKFNKLELISKMNQEKMDLKLNMQVRRNFSYFEVGENVIKELISPSDKDLGNKSFINKVGTREYREKQIKFCYALLNLKNSDLHLLELILQRLSNYQRLETFEVNFLLYLWNFEGESFDFAPILSEKFPLILERLILKYCTEILHLKEDIDVQQYFLNLKMDENWKKIIKSCVKNIVLSKSMKSLIYELYCYSFCNKNILRLINLMQ